VVRTGAEVVGREGHGLSLPHPLRASRCVFVVAGENEFERPVGLCALAARPLSAIIEAGFPALEPRSEDPLITKIH
jgi:hypothetical protein